MHKSGFISIIGLPNAGKSTLLNALLGENLVIVNPKAQTTRRRILGIFNDDDCQIVFSDTPGYIEDPKYELHKSMNNYIFDAIDDADLIIYITEPNFDDHKKISESIEKIKSPLLILINKADINNIETLNAFAEMLSKTYSKATVKTISALHNFNIDKIIPFIKNYLPLHPPFFPKEDLSDMNIRFFISEIIREKILSLYQKEIPYSSEVIVEEYKEKENITHIRCTIYVERETQKMIILGKAGSAIKKLSTQSRLAIESFIKQRVYLDITVKVLKNWRNELTILKKLGYKS